MKCCGCFFLSTLIKRYEHLKRITLSICPIVDTQCQLWAKSRFLTCSTLNRKPLFWCHGDFCECLRVVVKYYRKQPFDFENMQSLLCIQFANLFWPFHPKGDKTDFKYFFREFKTFFTIQSWIQPKKKNN